MQKHIRTACLSVALLAGCSSHKERALYAGVPAPITQPRVLVLGFMGGRNKPNDPRFGVGRFAKRLRELDLPCVRVETFANDRRDLALELVRNVLDRDHDGQASADERETTRLVLYGQSFGGAAVVKFARQLKEAGIPVTLAVIVDAVGRDDEVIPANVAEAANLFQDDSLIHGPKQIRAQDPLLTHIIGNFHFDYRGSAIDISDLPWHKKLFQESHARMDRDPAVWNKVEELILVTLARDGWCTAP